VTQAAARVEVAPATRGYPTAWWGMMTLITTEGMVFLALVSSYFFLRAAAPQWPPDDIPPPELIRSGIFSVILLSSSIPIFIMESALRRDRMRTVKLTLLLAFLMGSAFLANTGWDFAHLEPPWRENAYSSLFHIIIGLHALHVLVGLVMSLVVQAKVWTKRVSSRNHVTPDVFALYWHFVDGVWIIVFTSLFLTAHLGP
jgi:heme/copper-type cytochrome/quinol oxidase subunit 3